MGRTVTELDLSHEEELKELRDCLHEVEGLSEFFKIMADETRVRVLRLLSKSELCVFELSALLDMSLPAISHHLRLLKMMKLVAHRREGRHVFYCLDDHHVEKLITVAVDHYKEINEKR